MNYKIHAGKGMEKQKQLKDWEKVEGSAVWQRGCEQRAGSYTAEAEASRNWARNRGLSMGVMANLPVSVSSPSPHSSAHSILWPNSTQQLYWGLRWPPCLQVPKVLSNPHFAWFSPLYNTVNHSLFRKWSLSLASKTTHAPYFFPTSLAPVY